MIDMIVINARSPDPDPIPREEEGSVLWSVNVDERWMLNIDERNTVQEFAYIWANFKN